ncbi:MAG TPA: helix-turn-helix domain-containing protein [Polyangiaceae bacterium]
MDEDEAAAEKIVLMLVAEVTERVTANLAQLLGQGPEQFLTTTELAAVLKSSPKTIRAWAKEGCPHVRVGKDAHRFRLTEVVSWLQSRQP